MNQISIIGLLHAVKIACCNSKLREGSKMSDVFFFLFKTTVAALTERLSLKHRSWPGSRKIKNDYIIRPIFISPLGDSPNGWNNCRSRQENRTGHCYTNQSPLQYGDALWMKLLRSHRYTLKMYSRARLPEAHRSQYGTVCFHSRAITSLSHYRNWHMKQCRCREYRKQLNEWIRQAVKGLHPR